MKSIATPSIPAYAHPVRVGADGIRFRRVHGPRTLAATMRRKAAGAATLAALTAKTAPAHTPAQFLAVAR